MKRSKDDRQEFKIEYMEAEYDDFYEQHNIVGPNSERSKSYGNYSSYGSNKLSQVEIDDRIKEKANRISPKSTNVFE